MAKQNCPQWTRKEKFMIVDKIKKREPTAKRTENQVDIQVGKWVKCDKCKEILYKETVRANSSICPNCGAYFRMHINKRLESIVDANTYQKFDLNIDTSISGGESYSFWHQFAYNNREICDY